MTNKAEQVASEPYRLASLRVAREPRLAQHVDTILYDWPDGDEHWQWVASAPVAEIVDWALSVEG